MLITSMTLLLPHSEALEVRTLTYESLGRHNAAHNRWVVMLGFGAFHSVPAMPTHQLQLSKCGLLKEVQVLDSCVGVTA